MAGIDQLGGSGSGGSGPAAATTVTGPDAYGAAAAVGTSTAYARADHDHGLPAAPAGGSGAKVYSAHLTADLAVAAPIPASPTVITGLSITLPASSTARTVLVSAFAFFAKATGSVFTYAMLDGTPAGSQGEAYGNSLVPPATAGDLTMALWNDPITVPGDNATHTIALGYAAQASTDATTFRSGSYISLVSSS